MTAEGMQKKIIALAVAAVASGAAFAQTNVTVYGVVDVQEAFVKSSGGYTGTGYTYAPGATSYSSAAYGNQSRVGRLDSHGNYIGFKGVEDLGNGLKALFLYETALSTDNGGAFSGGRDAYVGLTGGFGTVVAGNLTHPLRAMGAKVELLPGAAGFGTTASVTGSIGGIKTGADDRASNAIAYISPSFSGFSATVAYVNGEYKTSGNATAGGVNVKQWQIAAQYENGPLWVGAGFHRASDVGATVSDITSSTVSPDNNVVGVTGSLGASAGQKASIARLAATYSLPSQTKLTALFDQTRVDATASDVVGGSNIASGRLKRNAFSLGVAQSFGKNTIGLEYAKAFKLKADGQKADDSTANIWTAMYSYDLSKRTSLHARYSRLSNDDGVNNAFYNSPVSNGANSGVGSNYTGYSLGLRHTF